MKILVTGAYGFVGKNLVAALRNIRDGKDRTHPGLNIEEICEFGRDTGSALLAEYCWKADFVFHLAGVNRPKNSAEYIPYEDCQRSYPPTTRITPVSLK